MPGQQDGGIEDELLGGSAALLANGTVSGVVVRRVHETDKMDDQCHSARVGEDRQAQRKDESCSYETPRLHTAATAP
jgi:hypothetical protein